MRPNHLKSAWPGPKDFIVQIVSFNVMRMFNAAVAGALSDHEIFQTGNT